MRIPNRIKRFFRRRIDPTIAPPIPIVETSLRFASVRESTNLRLAWVHAGELPYWRSGLSVVSSPNDMPVGLPGTTLTAWIPPAPNGQLARLPVRIFYAKLFVDWLDCFEPPDEPDSFLFVPSSVRPQLYTVECPQSFGQSSGRLGTIKTHWQQHIAHCRKQHSLYLNQHGFSPDDLDDCPF